jgi:hypothetical protein
MMNRTIRRRNTVTTAAVGLAAVVTLAVGDPVAAAPTSALFVGGGGLAQVDAAGSVLVEGPGLVQDKHLREMLDATIRATMATADGTLPALGTCEPATATFVVDGERDSDMTLVSQGTVCHTQHPSVPAYIAIEFDGRHEVVEAKRPQLRGVTGSLAITMSTGGFTSLYADSFVPSP